MAPVHVDVCTDMSFGWTGGPMPGAAKASTAVQVPVYESLADREIERIGRLVREQAGKLFNARRTTNVRITEGA